MYPFFLESLLGDKVLIPMYGLLLALAFTLSYLDSIRRALVFGLDPKHIENLFLIIVLGSVLGSRGFHVLFENFSYYREHPVEIFYFWQGGFTFYGALITAATCTVYYAYKQKISIPDYADAAAPAVLLGLFVGRLGCFMAGCCWGKPTDLPWGIAFTHPHSFASPLGVPLHPTQLYESFLSGATYTYLAWRTTRRRFSGELTIHALWIYAVIRFLVEFYRGDAYRGFVMGFLSTSQFISLLLFVFATGLYFFWSKAPKAAGKKVSKKKK